MNSLVAFEDWNTVVFNAFIYCEHPDLTLITVYSGILLCLQSRPQNRPKVSVWRRNPRRLKKGSIT